MRVQKILIIGIAMAFTACASKPYIIKEISPKQIITTENDDRPKWTTKETFIEEEGKFVYSGGVIGGADYMLTLRLAKAEATKNLLESIQVKARSEFNTAMHGKNRNTGDIGMYVTDAVAWTVDNLKISGIRQRKIYYEQFYDVESQTVKFNAWVQLEIPKSDYLKAKTDAAKKMVNKAIREKDQEAKEKAMELLEKLQQDA
jgi:hypothetical protein